MTRWQAVVFDLDDTLYPERDYVQSGMRAVACWAHEHLGLPAQRTFGELCRLFDQGVRGDTFDRWLEGRGLKPGDWVPAMVRVYRDHRPQIAPYPDVRSVLESLRGAFRLGLVTDGYLAVQRRKLAALALEDCFDAVVYSDAFGRDAWKPDPRPFETVLRRLPAAAGEAVYVADNPAKDFRGARRVGMATLRIRRADGLYRRHEPAGADDAPDGEIAGLGELRDVLVHQRRGRRPAAKLDVADGFG